MTLCQWTGLEAFRWNGLIERSFSGRTTAKCLDGHIFFRLRDAQACWERFVRYKIGPGKRYLNFGCDATEERTEICTLHTKFLIQDCCNTACDNITDIRDRRCCTVSLAHVALGSSTFFCLSSPSYLHQHRCLKIFCHPFHCWVLSREYNTKVFQPSTNVPLQRNKIHTSVCVQKGPPCWMSSAIDINQLQAQSRQNA